MCPATDSQRECLVGKWTTIENAKKVVLCCVASCFELFSDSVRSCVECAAGGEGACRAKRLRNAWKARKHGFCKEERILNSKEEFDFCEYFLVPICPVCLPRLIGTPSGRSCPANVRGKVVQGCHDCLNYGNGSYGISRKCRMSFRSMDYGVSVVLLGSGKASAGWGRRVERRKTRKKCVFILLRYSWLQTIEKLFEKSC